MTNEELTLALATCAKLAAYYEGALKEIVCAPELSCAIASRALEVGKCPQSILVLSV